MWAQIGINKMLCYVTWVPLQKEQTDSCPFSIRFPWKNDLECIPYDSPTHLRCGVEPKY